MTRFSKFWPTIIATSAAASAACMASEVETHVPATALASQSQDVIDRAVRAITVLEGESHLTRVWVFPTGDINAVFVHYRTTSDVGAHEPGLTIEHFVMLEMSGERIAKLHDLTLAPVPVAAVVSNR